MGISLPGIGSNLDVEALVTQLMKLERRPLDLLESQSKSISTKVSAYGSLKGLLSTFQGTLTGFTADKLGAMTATVSDAALASASATSKAAEGTHSLEVLTLAQPHRLRTATFASSSDPVGTGTLTFEFGTWDGTAFSANAAKPAQAVTIAPGQSTLAGVRDAVNAAGIGVTASVVNTGSGEVLVFASKSPGAASSLRITVADGDGNATDAAGLSQLAYDPAAAAGAGMNLTQVQAATDASFVLDGIAMTRTSNAVADALEGVTLTLAKAAPGEPATLGLARDDAAVQSSVESFVKGYNDVRKSLANAMAYESGTKAAGPLKGESVLRQLEAKLRAVIGTPPAGLGGEVRQLTQAGVSLKADGTLALDTAKLRAALATDPEGVAALFAATGRSADSRISLSGFTSKTAAGSYAVAVTQPATRGSLAGSAPPNLTIGAGVNDSLTVQVDGVSATVTLSPGAYASAAALAAEVQSRLNGATALSQAGIAVDAAIVGGNLTLTSRRFGIASTVAGAAGSAAADLLGAPLATAGQDVAGTLGGAAATGLGRILTGSAGSGAEGLGVRVAATAAGTFTLDFSRGHADRLASTIGEFLATDGGISTRVDSLNAAIKRSDARGDALQRQLDITEKRLRAQFATLDSLMARMNQTSAYLTQQLANLPGSSKG